MKTRQQMIGTVASACMVVAGSIAVPGVTHAADGCKFLLCIAGPWRSISECVPTVKEVFHDLAKGRAFPTCSMSGDGNTAWNRWNSEQSCPVMYRAYGEFGYEGCQYPGQITVQMNSEAWSTVYWDFEGNTSTLWADKARQALSQPGALPVDTTYELDLATWTKGQEPGCKGRFGVRVECQ